MRAEDKSEDKGVTEMSTIIIAIVGSTAISQLVQFFVNRHDTKKNFGKRASPWFPLSTPTVTWTFPLCRRRVTDWFRINQRSESWISAEMTEGLMRSVDLPML